MSKEKLVIQSGGNEYEGEVDATLMPALTRLLTGTTPIDDEIDSLDLPQNPNWLKIIVFILKSYRNRVSNRLGHRCVYEPSCSRYSELAFRKYGLLRGSVMTIKRLFRCRPGYGGIDLP